MRQKKIRSATRFPPYQHWSLYNICTILVQLVNVQILYKYCTYIVQRPELVP